MVSQPQNAASPCDTVPQLSQESLPEALASSFLQDPDPGAAVWDTGQAWVWDEGGH